MNKQHMHQTDTPEAPETDLQNIEDRISACLDSFMELIHQLYDCADRLYGPPPPSPVADSKEIPIRGGAIGSLRGQVDRFERALMEMADAVARLGSLV